MNVCKVMGGLGWRLYGGYVKNTRMGIPVSALGRVSVNNDLGDPVLDPHQSQCRTAGQRRRRGSGGCQVEGNDQTEEEVGHPQEAP